MTIEQAIQVLEQVCAGVQATLQGHQQIQTALQTVKNALHKQKLESVPTGEKTQ